MAVLDVGTNISDPRFGNFLFLGSARSFDSMLNLPGTE